MLAAAPQAGERREMFAKSLVSLGRLMLMRVMPIVCLLAAARAPAPRVPALLNHCCLLAQPALQLQGIEGVMDGDYTSPFALAKLVLEVGGLLL